MKILVIIFLSVASLNVYSQERDQFKKSSMTTIIDLDDEQKRMLEKMVEDLTVHIQNDKSNMKLAEERAKIYFILKEYENSILDYDHLIQMDSGNARYYYFRGLNKLSNNDQFQACEDFKKAKDLSYDYNGSELMLICQ